MRPVLTELTSPAFDPEKSVLVAGGVPPAPPATNANPGTVEFASYAPKHVVLKCDASDASVLLLNDRFDPYWKVQVDGKPQPLLRCNYLMRGVYLAAGTHTVDFRFQPPIGPLYVSLAGIGVGVVILCMLFVTERGSALPVPAPALEPKPAPPPARGKNGSRRASNGRRRPGRSSVRHSNGVME